MFLFETKCFFFFIANFCEQYYIVWIIYRIDTMILYKLYIELIFYIDILMYHATTLIYCTNYIYVCIYRMAHLNDAI